MRVSHGRQSIAASAFDNLIAIKDIFLVRGQLGLGNDNNIAIDDCVIGIPYSARLWQGKTLVNRLFCSFGKENVGEFTIANISCFSESG